jgi:hypothetical protein
MTEGKMLQLQQGKVKRELSMVSACGSVGKASDSLTCIIYDFYRALACSFARNESLLNCP